MNRFATDLGASPTANGDIKDMLTTGVEASSRAKGKDLLLGQKLANGMYQVDLWAMSPTKRDRAFDIEIEGTTMEQVTVSGKKGEWQKLSYTTTVTDGQLDLVLGKVRKSPVISGVAFSSIVGDQGPEPTFSNPKDGDGNDGNEGDEGNPNSGNNNTGSSGGGADGGSGEHPSEPIPPTNPSPPSSGTSPTGGKLIWQNNFSGNWEQNWPRYQNTTSPQNREVIQGGGGFGDILRVNYKKGGVGASAGTQFKSTFAPMKTATLQYDIRFKEGFDPVLGGKLPGFTGGLANRKKENTGGDVPDGTDGWSVRLGFRPAKSDPNALAIRTYSYLPPGQQDPKQNNEYVFDAWGNKTFWSGKGKWGLSNHFLNPDDPEAGKDLHIQTGEWYTVSLQVSLNTPGKNDGFIKGFIKQPGTNESQLALHVPNLKFQNAGSNLPIDRVFFSTFFGGGRDRHRAKRDEHIDFDNFKVFKQA
ncbi:MAG: polysaccharide lyase [Cyanobacteria bacterium P01_F01_bin.53]